ncbi:MAG: FG-GAP-like repeat-containing protein [Myxococcota bacterium]
MRPLVVAPEENRAWKRAVRALGLLALAAGCSDYDLVTKDQHGGKDAEDTGAGPDTDENFSEICEGLEGSRHDVALNAECDVELQTGSFTPVVEYHYGTTAFCGPPSIGQIVDENGNGAIDSDDLPAVVIFQSGRVVAVKGDNSGVYWQTTVGNLGQDGGFAIGDLDGDGWPEVVAAGVSSVAALDGRTGEVLWTSQRFSASLDPLGYNYPSISDMDHDGNPEVTVGNVILDGASGSTLGRGTAGIGAAPYSGTGDFGSYGALSVPVDLDGDGLEELVTGNAAYNMDGSVKWRNDGLDGLIAVADFDGDGDGEIVKTSGIFVTGMDTDGEELWSVTYAGGNLGAASIDDIDADGTPDIVFAATNSLVALDWGGRVKWEARISDQSGAAGPVLFDFENDGYPEVLFADEGSIMFFNGLDGSVKFRSMEHGSYTILETPVVADVDNDDQVEIILGHCSWNRSFSVYGDADESWPPGRKIWNQHGYQITNVEDLGGIPTTGGPNWPEYNSFRSGDAGQPPGEFYDVQVEIFDVCENECDADKVYVGAWIGNAGNLEIPAGVPVSITAGPSGAVLATQYTSEAVAPGEQGEALIFEIAASAIGGAKPVAKADSDVGGSGILFECDELNNIHDWGDKTCAE